ncbi:MAG: tetratricopeptide repeat protein [Candidatus Omnitrophica bacterium]|nr:tetratricopeptide repeat protein [Candidatus Omnitrophota bacterium]
MPQIPKRIKILLFVFFLCLFYPSLGSCATLRDRYESALDFYNKGEFDKSIEIYQDIIKDVPQFAPAYIGLGLALKSKGSDIEEVVYYYKMAVEKDPTNSQALEQLGRLYYSIGQLDKAKVSFEKVLKINPNMPAVKLTLGWICLLGKSTNPGRAIIYFKDVIKTIPNPNAYFGLGIAYFANNQREKVLDVITQLRDMGQEDFADRLEKSVRENRRVVLDDFVNTSDNQDEDQSKNSFENTSDVPKGIKVRLRGRLDQL